MSQYSDTTWVVTYVNGDTEEIRATPRTHNGVLYMEESYGVTGGLKSQVCIPLTSVLHYRKKEQE